MIIVFILVAFFSSKPNQLIKTHFKADVIVIMSAIRLITPKTITKFLFIRSFTSDFFISFYQNIVSFNTLLFCRNSPTFLPFVFVILFPLYL